MGSPSSRSGFFIAALVAGLAGCAPANLAAPPSNNPAPALVSPTKISIDLGVTAAYYRFESGPAGHIATKIIDSSGNDLDGSILAGGPTYSSTVPNLIIPKTHKVDKFSLQFATGDALKFGYAFPFQTQPDATVELWVNPSTPYGGDIFWTTLSNGDANRFNIGIGANPGPAFIDYRDVSGTLHRLGRSKVAMPSGEWSFIAYVKKADVYSIYVNNSQTGYVTTLESRARDTSPNLPTSTGWSINGRAALQPSNCCQFAGLIDEVRISNKALIPSQFLISQDAAPDTIYVQTSNARVIRQYKGASAINGLANASETLPTGDVTNGDVVYDPTSDTLWYPEANQTSNNLIEMWNGASNKNNMNPNALITFPFGEGAAAVDGTHHLLYVATTQGPQVSVYANPETMMTGATPAAVITLTITDNAPARPQEMLYDAGTDKLYVSDNQTVVARFDGFGAAAAAAVASHTNPTIAPNSYMQGLFSPDGLAYAPPPTDILFVGEQLSQGDVVVVHSASTWVTGPVGHSQMVTGFSRPGGMAFDAVRDLLFVYDTSPIYCITNAITMNGTIGTLVGNGVARVIIDATGQQNIGFGIALDTTH